jgi:hypothetical protein
MHQVQIDSANHAHIKIRHILSLRDFDTTHP